MANSNGPTEIIRPNSTDGGLSTKQALDNNHRPVKEITTELKNAVVDELKELKNTVVEELKDIFNITKSRAPQEVPQEAPQEASKAVKAPVAINSATTNKIERKPLEEVLQKMSNDEYQKVINSGSRILHVITEKKANKNNQLNK